MRRLLDLGVRPALRRLALAAGFAVAIAGPAAAQIAGQSVGQLVAAGYQVLSFVPIQGGYTALLVNYRETTPVLLLCNLNLNPDTRQMVTSGCFEVL
ncbi:MAG: hypothetical protein IT534_09100 [Bauldia sp.]|nr:hypothetical protein [Bauldia sp.]